MKYIALFVLIITLSSCKSLSDVRSIQEAKRLSKKIENTPQDVVGIVEQAKRTESVIRHDVKSLKALLAALDDIVNRKWGKSNTELPSNKKYVKYSNDYQARAIVNFEQGWVRVETINKTQPNAMLIKATTATLLTSSDPNENDIFSSKDPKLGGEPFLYPQVEDQEGKVIRYQWRAQRFSSYLVNSQRKHRISEGRTIYSVEFPLVDNNHHLRKQKYSQYVLASARKYKLPASLIYGVIETESSFNPYAVSAANAYGLMQVVPATAGKDVYQRIKKKSGQPSKAVLFNPQQNIDIGSAYFTILRDNYLSAVKNKQSKHYTIISAYNGGSGNVFKSFHPNRQTAMNIINNHQPSNVLYVLTRKHPKAESRRYLEKVLKAEKGYQ